MELKTTGQEQLTEQVQVPARRGHSTADQSEKLAPTIRQGCMCSGAKPPADINGKAKIYLRYKNATQHLAASGLNVSIISKAGVGIIKTVTGHWTLQKNKTRVSRSTGAGNRYASSSHLLCKSPPLDPLAALVLSRQSSPNSLEHEPRNVKLCPAKPQNCRRIVVLGAPRTGKTSILRRFLRDGFTDQYKPTYEDFHRKLYQIRGENYQIDILDPAGERGFPAKRRLSILTGDIFLLVCSVDDRSSFQEVRALNKEIVAAKSKLLKHNASVRVPVVICVNKVDLDPKDRAVSRTEACRALGTDCVFFETSAKDCTNLNEMFGALAKSGGLPTETLPSLHRKISVRSYQALRRGRRAARGKRVPEPDSPLGALCPLTRRPSISSDLRHVLGSSSARKSNQPLEKCQIQ